jgi:Mycothiol maleylpyruvate isomerase N-terminal domain
VSNESESTDGLGKVGRAYRGCRQRVNTLVAALPSDRQNALVQACPGWRVRDVVAHLAGVVNDALHGRMDGVASTAWTAAQVASRTDMAMPDIVSAWSAEAPTFEEHLDQIDSAGRQAVLDAVTHEHDLRGALDAPGARRSDAVLIGLQFVAPPVVAHARDIGVSLGLRTPEESWGPSDADACLSGDIFTLLRVCTGRRAVEQIRSLSWEGTLAAPWAHSLMAPFVPRASRSTSRHLSTVVMSESLVFGARLAPLVGSDIASCV